jgi:putative intracellular protease/amidase
MRRRVLLPLPDHDFDVTEVAVPWRILTRAGHEVVFTTEHGATPKADPLLLTGVIFGKLGADEEPKRFYRELETTRAFQSPIRWRDIDPNAYDALLLPGGHAPKMKQYLGAETLHAKVAQFWKLDRPVAAICHGVIVLARAIDASTGKSVIAGHRTTCLPKYMERNAYFISFWKLGRYYRTYDAYVEDEVRAALDDHPAQFVVGPRTMTKRGSAENHEAAFVVEDGRYISARWPGDAYLFAETLAAKLNALP